MIIHLQKFLLAALLAILSLAIHSHSSAADMVEANLYIKDHKFFPEVLFLPTGKKLRITIHNQDNTIEEFESIELKREKIILANSSSVILLAPLPPGEYKFFGDFHPDTTQGKIVIQEQNTCETKYNIENNNH